MEQFYIQAMNAADPAHGYNISPTAGSIRGLKYSDESKAKMSAWQIGRKMSADSIERRRQTIQSRPPTEKELAARKRAVPFKWATQESEDRRRVASKKYWGSPASKEHAAKLRAAQKTPEFRAKLSAALIGRKMTKEWRERLSLSNKGKKHSAEARAKMSAAQKKRYSDPAQIKILSDRAKAWAASHRDELVARGKRIYATLRICPTTGDFLKSRP